MFSKLQMFITIATPRHLESDIEIYMQRCEIACIRLFTTFNW